MEKPAVRSVGSGISVSFDHGVRAALWEGEGGGTVSPGDPSETWVSVAEKECGCVSQ